MPFDEFQTKAISISPNAVVSAGAGSGKTTVLAERFSHLVIDRHLSVDQILTLTFTRKATVEMYGRIYRTLHQKAPEAAEKFHTANIKTLDSYCTQVAKTGCHLYGLSPDFTEDTAKVEQMALSEAVPFLLNHSSLGAVKALVSTGDIEAVAKALLVDPIVSFSSIAEPIDFPAMLEKQAQTIIQEWNKAASEATRIFDHLVQCIAEFDGNKATASYKAVSEAMSKELPEHPVLSSKDDFPKYAAAMEAFSESALAIGRNKPRGNGMTPVKEACAAMAQAAATLSQCANFAAQFGITEEAMSLLDEFQNIINGKKRALRLITYADAASLATCILRDHPKLRAAEKKKYKAIMIDEFQDNNALQRDLLFMLAEKPGRMEKGIPPVSELCPDKLFFVGDEKQSIYQFRGADVSVFRALSKDFPDGNLALSTNYRSKPALIAAFNTVFGGIPYPPSKETDGTLPSVFFTEETERESPRAVPAYEAVYHKVELPASSRNGSDADCMARRMHIALSVKGDDDGELGQEESEAAWVAQKIKKLITEDGRSPEDIAILFLTYGLQPMYERILLSSGIPYDTEVATGVFNDGPTNDIFSFLRLCAYPGDRLSYAKTLRSPFVNLSADETAAVLSAEDEPFAENAAGLLSPQSRRRFLAAGERIRQVRKKSMTEKLCSLVTYLWYDAGYRYETSCDERTSMYSSLYDRTFELARLADEENMSLAEFVDSVRTYDDETEKIENMDIPLEQKSGVHLLTIYKSKGLEYPVVFICGTHKKRMADRSTLPVYAGKEFGIVINAQKKKSKSIKGTENYFFSKIKEENERKDGAELRRIAYVAITRAKEEVYVTGKQSIPESCNDFLPGGAKSPRSILDVLSPVIMRYKDDEQNSPFTYEEIPPGSRTQARLERTERTTSIALVSRLYDEALLLEKETVPSPYVSPSHLHDGEEYAAPEEAAPLQEINSIVESSGGAFGYDDFGTAAHAYMEAALTGQAVNVPESCLSGIAGKPRLLKKLEETCGTMQLQFMQSGIGQEAASSPWRRTEYSFRCRTGSVILSGQMDLVFKSGNGFTIVDYKTDQHIAPEVHAVQLACYRLALSEIMGCPTQDIRCVLYYLRFAKPVDISDECGKVDVEAEVKGAATDESHRRSSVFPQSDL